jgi:hypothetical protein
MKRVITLVFILITSFSLMNAQDKDAYNYLSGIGEYNTMINQQFLRFASAVTHSKRARKVENRRIDLVKSVLLAKDKISKMPCFHDECALRDSMISFLTLNYYVLTYSYDKILNMEDLAEQSYDKMELYINARYAADEKIRKADDKIDELIMEFMKKYNLPVSNKKDKMSITLDQVNKINEHYNTVYLIFFKSSKQEYYLLEALNKKDFSSAEQNRNALIQATAEGFSKIDTLKAFRNDRSIINACKRSLEFYKSEAKDKIGIMIDFYLKQENFDKLNQVYKTKDRMLLSKEEVDQYNKAVTELNNASKKYAAINNSLNQLRENTYNNWNNIVQNYFERYVPKVN